MQTRFVGQCELCYRFSCRLSASRGRCFKYQPTKCRLSAAQRQTVEISKEVLDRSHQLANELIIIVIVQGRSLWVLRLYSPDDQLCCDNYYLWTVTHRKGLLLCYHKILRAFHECQQVCIYIIELGMKVDNYCCISSVFYIVVWRGFKNISYNEHRKGCITPSADRTICKGVQRNRTILLQASSIYFKDQKLHYSAKVVAILINSLRFSIRRKAFCFSINYTYVYLTCLTYYLLNYCDSYSFRNRREIRYPRSCDFHYSSLWPLLI